MEPIVLEEWLRVASSSFVPSSSSPALPAPDSQSAPDFGANAIVHAWARIRACVQRKTLTSADSAAFDVLNWHRRSLHLADSQAKLLQALLTDVSSSDASFLGYARRFGVLGLLAWIRKTFTVTTINSAPTKQQAPETLASVVQSIRKSMEERPLSDQYTCEVILVLGTISTLEIVAPEVRRDCFTTIASALRDRKDAIARGAIAEALAGAGLALSVSQEHFVPILRELLLLWAPPPWASGTESPPLAVPELGKNQIAELDTIQIRDCLVLKDVVMLLHLTDYLGSIFLSRQSSQTAGVSQVELVHDTLLSMIDHNRTECAVQCTTIMSSVGLLRSLYRWVQGNKMQNISVSVDHKWLAILANVEGLVVKISEQAVSPYLRMSSSFNGGLLPAGVSLHAGTRQLRRFVSVAVSRCRRLPAHPCILHCLLTCIFGDTLYLDSLYSALTAGVVRGRSGISQQQDSGQEVDKLVAGETSDQGSCLDDFQAHVESFFFQQIGTMARAMCEQYRRSSGDLQGQTEHLISDYAKKLYQKHRILVAASEKPLGQGWPEHKQTLEKVLEAAFMTVVVFFSVAVREYEPDNNDSSGAELAALALDTLSCVEYFRHVQLREFTKVIQHCISQISRSEAASLALAHFVPNYEDIIKRPGTLDLSLTYSWSQDEVQMARILFYFRVLPMCFSKMPEGTFTSKIAPLIFLYMQHPAETVSKASHAVFAAYLSFGARPELGTKLDTNSSLESTSSLGPETNSTMTIREQLVAFYMERALQTFPGVTPFQGLVAGVGAIARQLPSGSPATVHCLNSLVDKTIRLYDMDLNSSPSRKVEREVSNMDSRGETSDQLRKLLLEDMGAAQKLQILLLHLILLVDLQVLPTLLKLMAKLILGLPRHLRSPVLAETFDVVGSSDDYTRKPIIVPWLQSLSFLSSNIQEPPETRKFPDEEDSSSKPVYTPIDSSGNPETASERKIIGLTSRAESSEGNSSDTPREDKRSSLEIVVEHKKEPISEGGSSEDITPGSMGDNEHAGLAGNQQTSDEGKKLVPISGIRYAEETRENNSEQVHLDGDTLAQRSRL